MTSSGFNTTGASLNGTVVVVVVLDVLGFVVFGGRLDVLGVDDFDGTAGRVAVGGTVAGGTAGSVAKVDVVVVVVVQVGRTSVGRGVT